MMNKRFPTLLGLVFLVVGVVGGVLLVQRSNNLGTQASSEFTPQNIQLSNIAHNSFTVSWSTQKPTTGFVKWGDNKDELRNISVIDETKKHTHYIQIDNLLPSTTYYFHVYSDSRRHSQNNDLFIVKTGTKVSQKPTTEIASGKIVTKTGLEVDRAIVYAEISGGSTLSDISADNGGWLIPLSNMRSKDLSNYLKIDKEDYIEIFVDAGPLGTAKARIKALESDPVPPIILGRQLDFTDTAVEFNDEIPDASLNIEDNEVKSIFDFPFN